MTKDEILQFLDGLDFGREFTKFVSIAQQRLKFFGKPLESDLGGVTSEDIVQNIFVKLLEKPDNIPRGIDLAQFRQKITNRINNAVKCHIKKKVTKLTTSFDPTEEISDDLFFDFITGDIESQAQAAKLRLIQSNILDKIADELALKDADAWIVLTDLRDGKKPGQIADDNGIEIRVVRNLIKRIDRLILSKSSVPIKDSII